MMRRIEPVCGSLAGLLGILGMAYATFGPTYHDSAGGTATLLQVNGPAVLAPVLFMTGLVVVVAGGALVHAQRRRDVGLVLLWGGAVLLALVRVITGFSIGVFLQPATALGLISAVAGGLAGRHPGRAIASGIALFWISSSLLYFAVLGRGDALTRIGQSLVLGPLVVLQWIFDPRYLLPLLR